MNNNFVKLLKFEYKLNFIHWAISLFTFIILIAWLMIQNHIDGKPFVFGGSYVPLIIFFSSFITLHSYSESTTRQSMELYHLLPVSRNTKFFSKQLITFIAFPLLLVLLYLLISTVLTTAVFGEFQRPMLSPNIKPAKIAMLSIWSHAFATLFAIIFKKRKLLYAIAAYFIFQFSLVIGFIIWNSFSISSGSKVKVPSLAFTSTFTNTVFAIAIAGILYIVSYRLFFRRQL
ncbi:hypothetical protein [uncultured Sunxiuqinia sp.]|uniref:hypothetical protein n=1 Tax=uncultured Sunxiuqinia sp. TaxID=1573825 RepID=UPI002AA65EBC|nr:hypothetical protein [uncultured Sunxiuqinia sp.]